MRREKYKCHIDWIQHHSRRMGVKPFSYKGGERRGVYFLTVGSIHSMIVLEL